MSNGNDQKQANLLEKIVELLSEQKKKTDDLSKSKEKSNEQLEKEYNWSKKSNDEKRREIQFNADLARMNNDQLELQDQLAKAKNTLLAMEKEAIPVGEEQAKAYHEQIGAQMQLVDSIAKATGMTEEQTQALLASQEAMVEVTESTKKFAKEADGVFSDLAAKSAIFGDPNKGMVGSMFKFAASMKSADGAMGTLGKSFLKHFNFTTLATGIVENITESTIGMVKAFDEAAASFAKATGTGDEFRGTMLEMRQEGNAIGVTFENSAAALQSLVQTQVGFLHSSKSAQKEMATQVALMERVGISTDTSAEMMNVFTINMGKSQKTAIQMTKALSSMGSVLGNSQKFLENFQESLKTLAVYGDDAVDVFSGMAAAARTAGVEVGTLTGMASKFDTFAEGAETVGKLNALLGSQLSSTEMLLMTEDKRIETLIQQVQISGESFSDMNKFQQMAIANAAGISDMNEAQRIFGMNMGDYKKYQKDMERQASMQENFNKAIEATIPLQEKFAQFMAEFALFVQPLANIAGLILEKITALMASMNSGTKTVIGLVAAGTLLYTAFAGIGAALPVVGAGAAAMTGGLTALTAAAVPAAPAMIAMGSAAGGAAIGMGAFALPMIGIGLTIAAVVLSVGYLVGQLANLASVGPEAVGVMIGFAGALYALSFAGAASAFGLGGIFLAMKTLTSGLSDVKSIIADDASAISNALENLALIATGKSARSFKGGNVALTTELKEAVQAVMTTKVDITLRINDGGLKKVVKDAMVSVLNTNGDPVVHQRIVKIANGEY
jgi:hypothetical protein